MRLFLALAAAALCVSVVVAYPQSQQSVDPAYLRQYYAHLAQANREGQEATPIYESGAQEQVYKRFNLTILSQEGKSDTKTFQERKTAE